VPLQVAPHRLHIVAPGGYHVQIVSESDHDG
jgi:hypothetical protein